MNTATASVYGNYDFLSEKPEDLGFSLPKPTQTKVHVAFRLLSFDPVTNQRGDSFKSEDVSDEAISSLVGSPIFANANLTDHFERNGVRGLQVGSVIDAKRDDVGILGVAAIQRSALRKLGINPAELAKRYSVSMETLFDPTESRYKVGKRILSREEAVKADVAAANAEDDNPKKYDARYLRPQEFHAVALLKRGANADRTADILAAVAGKRPKLAMFDFTEPAEEHRAIVETVRAEAAIDRERLVQRRVAELERWRPLSPREREEIASVADRTLDSELDWLQYKGAWFAETLASIRQTEAKGAMVPPTLRGGDTKRRDLFDFTDD